MTQEVSEKKCWQDQGVPPEPQHAQGGCPAAGDWVWELGQRPSTAAWCVTTSPMRGGTEAQRGQRAPEKTWQGAVRIQAPDSGSPLPAPPPPGAFPSQGAYAKTGSSCLPTVELLARPQGP